LDGLRYRSTISLRMTPLVKYLIGANVFLFFLSSLFGFRATFRAFGLIPSLALGRGMVYQLVSYMFLHGGIWHLLFNMWALWILGPDLERGMGEREFLRYYFLTGIGAGLVTCLFSYHTPYPTIGASGAIFGLLVAYALRFPDRVFLVYFLYPIKVKYLLVILLGLEIMASWAHTPDGIGHFAHLGGAAVGYIYLRFKGRGVRGKNPHLRRGFSLFNRELYWEANQEFEEALREDPLNGDAHYSRALTFLMLGLREKAMQEYLTLQAINPHMAEKLFHILSRGSK